MLEIQKWNEEGKWVLEREIFFFLITASHCERENMIRILENMFRPNI